MNTSIGTTEPPHGRSSTTLGSFDGNRTRTYLETLPCTLLECNRCHHVTVTTPKFEIRRLAVENISEWGVPIVAWAAQHCVVAVDLAGNITPFLLKGEKSIFQLVESSEIFGPRNADRRSVVTIAPRYDIFVVYERNARIITIHPFTDFWDVTREPFSLVVFPAQNYPY